MKKCELLAPAGGMDSAYAAIHYGADAIYLGLEKFSARAEAENFTPEQLGVITAFAHASSPRRKVFVTINTLVLNHEIPALIETLHTCDDAGVDAIIVQDQGVVHIARKYFPDLALHCSTQMAVHNLAGAITAREMGFRRVTLARELTIREIQEIAAESGIEVEVFLHGALCYSYSGLCLYSSMLRGSSGNRGRCNYPCRDSFEAVHGGKCFPFSMKDIALPGELDSLREAGVVSFKIEGRKKSPLYVAATTAYYRKLMDGKLEAADRKKYEDDIKTIFSRPWTNLYIRSEDNEDTVDSETVGHRGAPIGKVQGVINPGSKLPKLQFVTGRSIERHDGLQVDLPGRPFGFPVDTLLIMPHDGKGQGKTAFEAPAGSTVQVILPQDHPVLPKGSPIYCSSSQAVKNQYKFTRPRPGEFKVRKGINVEIVLSATNLTASAAVESLKASASLDGSFEKGRNAGTMESIARQSFEKLGDTLFRLDTFSFKNPELLFAPVSKLNRLRRDVLVRLQQEIERHAAANIKDIQQALEPEAKKETGHDIEWSIKTDTLSNLSGFTAADWKDVSELIIDIGNESLMSLTKEIDKYAELLGKERIRLALPAITRAGEEKLLLEKISQLKAAGWCRWEASNISAWTYLSDYFKQQSPLICQEGTEAISRFNSSDLDLSSDFSIYILNRAAALQVMEMGISRFVLSPEDGLENMSSLLKEFGERATVIVYQDSPLLISETCGLANITGACRNRRNCNGSEMPLVSGKNERVILITRDCRTIVINEQPYCVSGRLKELTAAGATRFRADFIYRQYTPARVREIWCSLRKGNRLPSTIEANFDSMLI